MLKEKIVSTVVLCLESLEKDLLDIISIQIELVFIYPLNMPLSQKCT